MTMINAYAGAAESLSPEAQALIARRERVLGPAYRLFYEEPLHLVRGEGVWLYDAEGAAYLDAYNNVASVGHCHLRVVDAMARQAAVLNTHTRYLTDGVVAYAERLAALFPAPLSQVMFTCTGSEANDLALRIARARTGGTGVVVTELAYHGVTQAVAELSPSLGAYVALGPNVRTVPAPRGGDAGVAERFARDVRAAFEDLRAAGHAPSALLVDTIFSSDGVYDGPAGFLAAAAAAAREAGAIFIADEVQPGFGRTGEAFWGFQRHGVVPDLVTMGKPMGNGHPVAGLVARPEVLAPFGQSCRYFNTFGGNPVSCAVGMAVLDVIEDEGLMANAAAVGAYLKAGLETLSRRQPLIAEVRGAGLFLGVELAHEGRPASAAAAQVVNGLRRRRVLVSATGPHANILKVRPPLVFTREHADLFLDALDDALGEVD
ncbi:MAG: aspartate aminotransferase family protein [Phenylobacterium sp.]|uniref:aspartate aminotransferase family protein n=1 Tax=Phenylobacterium sp. TaxID=1871053 RepID=UPI001A569079|nr:aspartate aminotransferase family protein [Phenylobacterium sp.]MBL8772107.1 aspartate aminotransferase family protein [Phenylobacterium sp.]